MNQNQFQDDDENMVLHQLAGTGYGFSAVTIDKVGSSAQTLVVIADDISGSTTDYTAAMEACIKEIVRALALSPRADSLMLRTTRFDDRIEEIHGFRPLAESDIDKYNGCLPPGGLTALYDATVNAVASVAQYGADLSAQEYDVNGIVFILTDGMDNRSKLTVNSCKEAIAKAVKGESLESLMTILIGVNVKDPQIVQYLEDFNTQVGFTQYVKLEDASAKTLAKLAKFVSHSVSSQSQALGTGGPSKAIDPSSLSI